MSALRYRFMDGGREVATIEVGRAPKLFVGGAPPLALTSTQLARTIAAWTASVQANAELTLELDVAAAMAKRAKKADGAADKAAPKASRASTASRGAAKAPRRKAATRKTAARKTAAKTAKRPPSIYDAPRNAPPAGPRVIPPLPVAAAR